MCSMFHLAISSTMSAENVALIDCRLSSKMQRSGGTNSTHLDGTLLCPPGGASSIISGVSKHSWPQESQHVGGAHTYRWLQLSKQRALS